MVIGVLVNPASKEIRLNAILSGDSIQFFLALPDCEIEVEL